ISLRLKTALDIWPEAITADLDEYKSHGSESLRVSLQIAPIEVDMGLSEGRRGSTDPVGSAAPALICLTQGKSESPSIED
ncbi:hypothetical protein KUCAC02_031634, partial [Chaenocephalus aceratus]